MSFSVSSSYSKLQSIVSKTPNNTLPSQESLSSSTKSIVTTLPKTGLGLEATEAHLLNDLTPGFNGPKTSANYYGFVTGGVLPIAEVADNVVTAFDQNVQVHLPDQSISTLVEDAALGMLTELVVLGEGWSGRTFTTGATGSNVLGLACGREAIIDVQLRRTGQDGGVGELGVLNACLKAGVKEFQVLTTMGHSSLYKAASVVGIGRASVKDIPVSKDEPWKMDIERLEVELARGEGVVSIVAISAGEVNTGRFAADANQMKEIRKLCDKYGAWLHVDGAFGLFARSLPDTLEFKSLRDFAAGIELADSIAGDCHKMLNVPYDCGVFFTRSSALLSSVFQNPNAAYLSSGPSTIPSPLNIGLENSRRFRALPVYSVLLAYGLDGFSELFARQVRLTRAASKFIDESEEYELLPRQQREIQDYADVHVIAIFRAKNENVNAELVKSINATRKMYVSGTKWEGLPACRIAVSTWKVDVERDLELITGVLKGVLLSN